VGYEVHITRADEWTESEAVPILLGEWLAYVKSDPEMRLDGRAVASTVDGGAIEMESEGLAVWTKYSGNEVDGNIAWMMHDCGRVTAKNADEEIIGKMMRIASALRARVIGDDGEEYGAQATPARAPSARPWWKRLLGG
jgi:hypothetical protein